jgi:hypothetical protein
VKRRFGVKADIYRHPAGLTGAKKERIKRKRETRKPASFLKVQKLLFRQC